ncbi:hypothetical protein E2C01_086376 [Portunus trituberculatus]|uniref:Secreted protein n=1 Tax=Portunus trituberculatus TaxID=210409 RepID=A0A5B7J944_PORTR|nr:hypothetical protein [Portunus trituberculatus]
MKWAPLKLFALTIISASIRILCSPPDVLSSLSGQPILMFVTSRAATGVTLTGWCEPGH